MEKEFNKMKNYFLKEVKVLTKKLDETKAELKQVKADYAVLLEVSTENHVTES